MVDAHRHEHQHGGRCHQQQHQRQRPGQRAHQPPHRHREPQHRHRQRQERGDAARQPFGPHRAHQWLECQDQRCDRQIDNPGPMHVKPDRRIEPILAQIKPALPSEQRAHLHQPHVIVGIAQREPAHRVPAINQKPKRDCHPQDQRKALPMAVDQAGADGRGRGFARQNCFPRMAMRSRAAITKGKVGNDPAR